MVTVARHCPYFCKVFRCCGLCVLDRSGLLAVSLGGGSRLHVSAVGLRALLVASRRVWLAPGLLSGLAQRCLLRVLRILWSFTMSTIALGVLAWHSVEKYVQG